MPLAKFLTSEERALIKAYKELGISNREISKKINRSEHAIRNFLKLGENYGKKARTKGNTKLTKRQKNQIVQEATKKRLSAGKILQELQLPVGKRRVQQILHSSPNLKYKKMAKKPLLKSVHKTARLEFARRHMNWVQEWNNVIFSDEKKFNLDGPDGCSYFWHDLSKKPSVKISRNFQGGSVMVWGAFSLLGKLPLSFITTRMNSEMYTSMLDVILIPFLEDVVGDSDFFFQQDNAAIHVSTFSRQWFASRDIPLLEWPACSPDLNPIENLWGFMAQEIYKSGKQYETVRDLKKAINECWESITSNYMANLVKSMPNRLFETIKASGGNTKY